MKYTGRGPGVIPGFALREIPEVCIEIEAMPTSLDNQDLFATEGFENPSPNPGDPRGGRIAAHLPWGGKFHWQFGTPWDAVPALPMDPAWVGVTARWRYEASAIKNYLSVQRNGVEISRKDQTTTPPAIVHPYRPPTSGFSGDFLIGNIGRGGGVDFQGQIGNWAIYDYIPTFDFTKVLLWAGVALGVIIVGKALLKK